MFSPVRISRSFTLIELMIVVAIISVLIALLMPSLVEARKKGRQLVCMSQQRQIGIANLNYANDYNQRLAVDCRSSSNNFLPQLLRADVQAAFALPDKIYQCPSRPVKMRDTNANRGQEGVPDYWFSYLFLTNGAGTAANWERTVSRRAARFRDDAPSAKLLVSDEINYKAQLGSYHINHPDATNQRPAGAVQTFLDGHTAWKRDFPPLLPGINNDASHISQPSSYDHYWY